MNKHWTWFFVGTLLAAGLPVLTASAAPPAAYQLTFTTQPVATTVGAKMASIQNGLLSLTDTNAGQFSSRFYRGATLP